MTGRETRLAGMNRGRRDHHNCPCLPPPSTTSLFSHLTTHETDGGMGWEVHRHACAKRECLAGSFSLPSSSPKVLLPHISSPSQSLLSRLRRPPPVSQASSLLPPFSSFLLLSSPSSSSRRRHTGMHIGVRGSGTCRGSVQCVWCHVQSLRPREGTQRQR